MTVFVQALLNNICVCGTSGWITRIIPWWRKFPRVGMTLSIASIVFADAVEEDFRVWKTVWTEPLTRLPRESVVLKGIFETLDSIARNIALLRPRVAKSISRGWW